jgi:hypothetical protein
VLRKEERRVVGVRNGLLPHWQKLQHYLEGNLIVPENDQENGRNEQEEQEETDTWSPPEQEEIHVASEQATHLFTCLSEGIIEGDNILNEINQLPIQVISDLYRLLRGDNEGNGLPPYKEKKDISAWIHASPAHRPFVWYNVDTLKQKTREKNGQSRMKASMKREDLISILASISLDPAGTYQSQYNGVSPIDIVIRTSFMQGLQGKAKKWASIGHQMEPILATKLLIH